MKIFVLLARFIYSLYVRRQWREGGKGFRASYPVERFNSKKVKIGSNVHIGCHTWINCASNSKNATTLFIGNGTKIGRFCHINAFESVNIEEDVLISDRVHISDATHNFNDAKIPILHQGDAFKGPVIIGRGAWLGCNSVIMPGVTIGRNAVVGANAVVTKNVPENSIAIGVPSINKEKNTGER